jgi:hypothetical protein
VTNQAKLWGSLLVVLALVASETVLAAADDDPKTIASRRLNALSELPAGAGKDLIAIACTRCHDLGGLTAYKGYWTRAQWLAMVETMVKHGALLDAEQSQQVTDYLNKHYGRHVKQE